MSSFTNAEPFDQVGSSLTELGTVWLKGGREVCMGRRGATSTMVTETLEQWPHWGVNTSPLPLLAMDYNIWRHKAELEEEEYSKVESTQEQGGEKEGSEIFWYRSEGGGEMARKRKIGRMTRDTCFAHYCVQVVWVKRSCPSASLSLNKHRA